MPIYFGQTKHTNVLFKRIQKKTNLYKAIFHD